MTKLCVFTSTRADFGILTPFVEKVKQSNDFELRLFVTGTHLLENHGKTVEEIRQAGFEPYYQVPIQMVDDKQIHHLGTMGNAIGEFAKALAKDLPCAAVILGDRYEALSFALAANGLGVPLIHLHGGEVTEGALDEAYRHCITKLSFLHFVATEKYRQRVIQMGEAPDRVFNFGALGVENIKSNILLSREELENSLSFKFKKHLIAVTYHPETSNPQIDLQQVTSMLEALQKSLNQFSCSIVFTRSNADHGGNLIHQKIDDFTKRNSSSCLYVQSLGMKRYLSLLKTADIVVGNSSSGIIEAPALGTPTINVGERQKGREMAKSVFSVTGDTDSIFEAVIKAFEFKTNNLGSDFSVYGEGNTSVKMIEVLKTINFSSYPKKMFFDHESK